MSRSEEFGEGVGQDFVQPSGPLPAAQRRVLEKVQSTGRVDEDFCKLGTMMKLHDAGVVHLHAVTGQYRVAGGKETSWYVKHSVTPVRAGEVAQQTHEHVQEPQLVRSLPRERQRRTRIGETK